LRWAVGQIGSGGWRLNTHADFAKIGGVKPLADCKLYTFVDTAYLHGRAPELVAQQLCDGGSDLIQLRAKNSAPDEIRRMAEKILPITRRANVGLVINDHLDIAKELGADICHLGQEDFFDAGHTHIRQLPIANCQLKIGLSTHAPTQAQRAIDAGADYVAIGPIYATGTKPTAKPVTLEYVRWADENVKIPWFAIGGINLQTLDAVLAVGAQRICVVSAILNASDIASACREFRKKLDA
jgi:thiamine-phosphate pyrophosphorylase